MTTRREFLDQCSTAVAAALCVAPSRPALSTILLRSGWQTENIGDIAHTPGMLRFLEDQFPHSRVILWGNALDRGVEPMLRRRFPQVRIVRGQLNAEQGASTEELKAAIEESDILLHGSGPSLVKWADMDAWHRFTGKPWGAVGITTQAPSERMADILNTAHFIFTRETHSLDHLRRAAVTATKTGFVPDATFLVDLRDDERAEVFLKEHGLKEGEFICVIPRLRFTPYYKFKPGINWSEEKIREVNATNAQWAEIDHAKMREAMIRWVRETGQKVLVVPEMTYQLDIMDELLIDPLPDDVKSHVVRRNEYWLTDEAASTYSRAAAVISFECHSPILAFAAGTPAIYLRQPQDTIKGQMWYDIGVPDWVFEIEQSSAERIANRLMRMHADRANATKYLATAMNVVNERYDEAPAVMRQSFVILR